MRVAVLIGLQASGKTTFYRRHLAGTHVHVSKDNFPNARNRQRRQLRLIGEALTAGHDVAVDNTNPSAAEWLPLVTLAHRHGAAVDGYWFPPDPAESIARNAVRPAKTRVPEVGIYATLKALTRPARGDGFDRLWLVQPDGRGDFTLTEIVE